MNSGASFIKIFANVKNFYREPSDNPHSMGRREDFKNFCTEFSQNSIKFHEHFAKFNENRATCLMKRLGARLLARGEVDEGGRPEPLLVDLREHHRALPRPQPIPHRSRSRLAQVFGPLNAPVF